jgi:hypothetical protein
MGDLVLKGLLNLKGTLALADKVIIDSAEALVESIPPGETAHSSSAPPVIMPPPPAGPIDPGTSVWVVNSFNKTVTTGNKPIVALGMAMQGNTPTWPGMVLPSQVNTGPVTVNFIPINVVDDQAVIFPSGGTAVFAASGQ